MFEFEHPRVPVFLYLDDRLELQFVDYATSYITVKIQCIPVLMKITDEGDRYLVTNYRVITLTHPELLHYMRLLVRQRNQRRLVGSTATSPQPKLHLPSRFACENLMRIPKR